MRLAWFVGVVGVTACAATPAAAPPRASAPRALPRVPPPAAPTATETETESAPETEAEPPLEGPVQVQQGACVVTGNGRETRLLLRGDGEPIAEVSGDLGAVAIALHAERKTGSVTLASRWMTITAETALAELVLYPRTEVVHEGWLRVDAIAIGEVHGASIRAKPDLPEEVRPRGVTPVDVPCAAVSTDRRSRTDEPHGEPWHLRAGRHPLRATPAGPVVADVVSRMGDLTQVTVIARSGTAARVVVEGRRQSVVAWISAAALADRMAPGGGGTGAGGAMPLPQNATRCPSPLPMMVIDRDGGARAIGVLKANAPFLARAGAEGRARHFITAIGPIRFRPSPEAAIFVEGPLPLRCGVPSALP